MDDIFFSINGYTFGYNNETIFSTDDRWNDKIIKTFNDILLVKITKEYAVFYVKDQNNYIKFDGEIFSEYSINENIESYNELDFDIIHEHNVDSLKLP
ncbi:MAG: hypothetical protein Ta2B_18230 [Termitinemataceae bacterium]|nr:MAG: hypothetical protein Ta2B_18230 [Termitinemataceae bacterium]